jgi:hypothetical protein
LVESLDGLHLRDILHGVSLIGPSLDVVPDKLAILLDAKGEVPSTNGHLVSAREVFDEGLLELIPIMDVVFGQAIKPSLL